MLTVDFHRGFTIIELLITMSIAAILMTLGAPAMSLYLQNSKVASAAANYIAGVQLARAEAIRRNQRVEFMLTNSPVSAAGAANAAVPDVNGRSWLVRAVINPVGPVFEMIDSKEAGEGEAGAVAPRVQVAGAGPAGFDGTIAFSALGATTAGAPITIDISNPTAGVCAIGGGPIRCRQINVLPGGQAAVCDPAAAAGDSRRGC